MIATHHGEWPSMRQNLYNVGDGCMPRGMVGVEACALSAREAATDIAGL